MSCADGDDDDGLTTDTNPTEPLGPPPDAPPRIEGQSILYTSSQTNAHSHSFAVLLADLDAPPSGGRVGTTTEAQLHSHALDLSEDVLRRAGEGETVQVETSSTIGHTHTFTLVRI